MGELLALRQDGAHLLGLPLHLGLTVIPTVATASAVSTLDALTRKCESQGKTVEITGLNSWRPARSSPARQGRRVWQLARERDPRVAEHGTKLIALAAVTPVHRREQR